MLPFTRARSEDADRVRARKFIAPAFSNINLQKIVPHLNENIDNIFQLFDELAVKNEPIEIGDVILHLMMSTLAKSSFDVDFSHLKEVGAKTEGANPSLINTHSFLHDMDTLIKERMKQLVLPYRSPPHLCLSLSLTLTTGNVFNFLGSISLGLQVSKERSQHKITFVKWRNTFLMPIERKRNSPQPPLIEWNSSSIGLFLTIILSHLLTLIVSVISSPLSLLDMKPPATHFASFCMNSLGIRLNKRSYRRS
jgi:hypothetical protein